MVRTAINANAYNMPTVIWSCSHTCIYWVLTRTLWHRSWNIHSFLLMTKEKEKKFNNCLGISQPARCQAVTWTQTIPAQCSCSVTSPQHLGSSFLTLHYTSIYQIFEPTIEVVRFLMWSLAHLRWPREGSLEACKARALSYICVLSPSIKFSRFIEPPWKTP